MYALPTFNQAKRLAWKWFKDHIPAEWVKKISDTDLTIETVFNSTLYIAGLDQAQRYEGSQYDGVMIDEASDLPPDVITDSILPATTHRNPYFWILGVPKSWGTNAIEYKKYCTFGKEGRDGWELYTWSSSGIIGEDSVDRLSGAMDAKTKQELLDGQWSEGSGNVFYAFSEAGNVSLVEYNPKLPLIVGSDFNVDPMAWVVCQKDGKDLKVVGELFIHNTNTRRTLDTLWEKWGHHTGGFVFTGDATSKARKTSADMSDYLQILSDERFSQHTPKKVLYTDSNPSVHSRVALTNALLCNAKGVNRLTISPSCVNLVRDLQGRGYKSGTKEFDDKWDTGHITDALGYVACKLYPLDFEVREGTVAVVPSMSVTSVEGG
jgi:hypothetical protein